LARDREPEIPGEFRFGDARHIISDSSKLRGLGWEAKASLAKVAREYIAWAESYPEVSDYYTSASVAMKEMGVIRVVR
jgi:dTDP-L-rhamnose 4-epimerase